MVMVEKDIDLRLGDSAVVLKELENDSVDSLVCDPPAGIGFMGKSWDKDKGGRDQWIGWLEGIMSEVLRVLKPGAHGLVWALPRTSHWTSTALENAGFEIRDVITHLFGCLSNDTEIYTARGWLKYNEITLDDKALCYDIDIVNQGFKKIEDLYLYDYNDIAYNLYSDNTDQIVSKNHRCIVERNGSKQFIAAEILQEKEVIPILKNITSNPINDTVTVKPINYTGKVWCIKVPTGIFLARRNGKLFITGNSGFPKSLNISKAIDKMQEAKKVEAKKWEGWGTALKPSNEHYILVRKPLTEKNVADNVLKHGTGAINVDESRVSTTDKIGDTINHDIRGSYNIKSGRNKDSIYTQNPEGRFPSNTIISHHPECELIGTKEVGQGEVRRGSKRNHSIWDTQDKRDIVCSAPDTYGKEIIENWKCHEDCPIRLIDLQSGISKSSGWQTIIRGGKWDETGTTTMRVLKEDPGYGDTGGASRYFKTFESGELDSSEHYILIRKPISEKNVADNVLKHGTGAINIDESRVATAENLGRVNNIRPNDSASSYNLSKTKQVLNNSTGGRFPSNTVLSHHPECKLIGTKEVKLNGSGVCSGNATKDNSMFGIGSKEMSYSSEKGKETVEDWDCHPDCPVKKLDNQSGKLENSYRANSSTNNNDKAFFGNAKSERGPIPYDDTGGASRFFKTFEGQKPQGDSEHYILIRKPISEKTVADNVLKHGTGAINIDESRVGPNPNYKYPNGPKGNTFSVGKDTDNTRNEAVESTQGRFPSNTVLSHHPECKLKGTKEVGNESAKPKKSDERVNKNKSMFIDGVHTPENSYGKETVEDWDCHSDCPVKKLDEQSGTLKSGSLKPEHDLKTSHFGQKKQFEIGKEYGGDEGGASRFFKTFEGEEQSPQGRFPSNTIISHHPECKLIGTKEVGKGEARKSSETNRTARDDFFSGKNPNKTGSLSSYGKEIIEAWDCHADCPVRTLDEQSGVLKSGELKGYLSGGGSDSGHLAGKKKHVIENSTKDEGGASRFFKTFNGEPQGDSEHYILVRKPLTEKNVADNVLKHGTGGINIDESRVGSPTDNRRKQSTFCHTDNETDQVTGKVSSRFPSNTVLSHHPECKLIGTKEVKGTKETKQTGKKGFTPGLTAQDRLSTHPGFANGDGKETVEDWDCHPDCPVKKLDDQSGITSSTSYRPADKGGTGHSLTFKHDEGGHRGFNDTGGASRFFKTFKEEEEIEKVENKDKNTKFYYCAKASKSEREQGLKEFSKGESAVYNGPSLDGRPVRVVRNTHPTVKPVKLMAYFIKMITPPKGIVLDCFCGSGSVGMAAKKHGFKFIGIELEEEYYKIAQARIASVKTVEEEEKELREKEEKKAKKAKKKPTTITPAKPKVKRAAVKPEVKTTKDSNTKVAKGNFKVFKLF